MIPLPTPDDFINITIWNASPWYVHVIGYIGILAFCYIAFRFIVENNPWNTPM